MKVHYRTEDQSSKGNKANQQPAVEITPIYNTTNNNIVSGLSAADTSLLLANSKTLSSFLASQSLLPIIQAAAAAGAGVTINNNSSSQPNANGIVLSSGTTTATGGVVTGGSTVDGNGNGVVVVGAGGGGGNNNHHQQQPNPQLGLGKHPASQSQGAKLGQLGLAMNNLSSHTASSVNQVSLKILPKVSTQQQLATNASVVLQAGHRTKAQVNNNNNNNTPNHNNQSQSHGTQANPLNDHGEMDEASSGGTTVGHSYRSQLSYRCGHCQQVSNWKHVIQVFTNNWSFGVSVNVAKGHAGGGGVADC